MPEETQTKAAASAITASIQLLREEARAAHNRARLAEDAIKGLQAVCKHSWISTGHGHNYETHECRICMLERHV